MFSCRAGPRAVLARPMRRALVPLLSTLCAVLLLGCARAPVQVVQPLTRDVSGFSASVRVTARKGLIKFLNPRERARTHITVVLREELDAAKTFRMIAKPKHAQLDLWVEVIEYHKPEGYSEDAVCQLEVRLTDPSKKRMITHFTAAGRATNRASKAEWYKSEERAVRDAVRRVVDYLGSVRLDG